MITPQKKTFFFYRHQRKGDAFISALRQFGWRSDSSIFKTSVAFFDIDIVSRIPLFWSLRDKGVKMFLYPHAAIPNVIYAWKGNTPHPCTSAQFVSAPGHEKVMRIIGYEKPIHVVGWSMCEKKEFRPSPQIKNVLFGPIHPNNATKWLHESDLQTNRVAFERLRKASKEMGFHLTVRHLYDLDSNGIPAENDSNVTYVRGAPNNSIDEIDRADLVVSKQTLGYLAVARGKPTIMMDEWIAPKVGDNPSAFEFIEGWDFIKYLMMYPYDMNTTSDVVALIEKATTSDEEIKGWKDSMLGQAFSPKQFADTVKSYITP